MKIEKSDWFIVFFVAVAVSFLVASAASAGGKHHKASELVTNIYVTEVTEVTDVTEVTELTNVTEVINRTQQTNIALGIAAAQHHYKATTQLQWSVGAGYNNDTSAVSLGLGLQAGKVFISGNFSSDGHDSAVGLGASGTF